MKKVDIMVNTASHFKEGACDYEIHIPLTKMLTHLKKCVTQQNKIA